MRQAGTLGHGPPLAAFWRAPIAVCTLHIAGAGGLFESADKYKAYECLVLGPTLIIQAGRRDQHVCDCQLAFDGLRNLIALLLYENPTASLTTNDYGSCKDSIDKHHLSDTGFHRRLPIHDAPLVPLQSVLESNPLFVDAHANSSMLQSWKFSMARTLTLWVYSPDTLEPLMHGHRVFHSSYFSN